MCLALRLGCGGLEHEHRGLVAILCRDLCFVERLRARRREALFVANTSQAQRVSLQSLFRKPTTPGYQVGRYIGRHLSDIPAEYVYLELRRC